MFRKFLLTLVALSGVSFLPSAHADKVVDNRWYVAPFGTFVQPGGDRQSDNGWGGGLGFGKILNEHFNVELRGFYQNLSGGKYGGSDITGGTADIQYYISRGTFSPYTVIALGGVNTSHNGKSSAGFIGEAGAGLAYEVTDNLLVRSDVRYRYNNNGNGNLQPGTNEFNDFVVNVGFVIPFGPKPKEVVAAAPVVAPAPVAVVKADCSALDSDHDGVNDCNDQCPNTLSGVHVSVMGCWIVDVKFDNDKDIIKPQYFANLDDTAARIKEHPELVIEIQGHTSKTGGFKHNMNLSERRALAVKKYLVDGSKSPNLTVRGYGWTRPISTNDTEEGRANNRRVQLEVNGQSQKPLN
ncbi:MAG: OmpA family protein [Methylococcales bacterium]